MSRIDEIQARVHAATLGPWYAEGWAVPDVDTGEFFELEPTDPDAIFIAHAREDIPWLLDEISRLTETLSARETALEAGVLMIEPLEDENERLTAKVEELERKIYQSEMEHNAIFDNLVDACDRHKARVEVLEAELAEHVEMKTAYDENGTPYLIEAEGSEAEHIVELLKAEADGRLVVLPCKVGETYYRIYRGAVFTDKVRTVFSSENFKDVLIRGTRFDSEYPNFKKTAFLTLEEAEAALQEGLE